MKSKIIIWKFEVSKSFERIMSAFLLQESTKINPYIEYMTINLSFASTVVSSEVVNNEIIMRIVRVGLIYNLDNLNFITTLYWKYKNGELPLYPHEEVEEKDIQFWIEGLDEYADRIRERFKSKPVPMLIEGYTFRVEMWKWDGVDAIFEITSSEEYFKQIAQIIDNAYVDWNELFEKGKKRHPVIPVALSDRFCSRKLSK